MPIVIKTDPITGKQTVKEMTSQEHLEFYHIEMAKRPQNFWCSQCETIQFLRYSQDPTDSIQYCIPCKRWVGSVIMKNDKQSITETEKNIAKMVSKQIDEK